MKRSTVSIILVAAFGLLAGSVAAYAQGTFKISFAFKADGKNFAPGEYWIGPKDDGQILLRQESTGKETLIPVLKKLEQLKPPVEEPQLVFHAVGNFAPSYTEYMTEYLLAEVWFPGQDGFLLHVTKGAHQRQTVKGQVAKK